MDKNSYELITPMELNVFSMEFPTNNCLVRYEPDGNDKTSGGIYVPRGDWEGSAARNVVRYSEVIKVPKSLYYNPKDAQTMFWKTTVEIQPGDMAIVDHLTANNSYIFTWKGEYFRVVPYSSIDAVSRHGEIMPINGNVLVKQVKKNIGYGAFEKEVDRENVYDVYHVGTRNTKYLKKTRRDFDMPLKSGDRVLLWKEWVSKVRDLEEPTHAKLGGFKVCKRFMIAGILEE